MALRGVLYAYAKYFTSKSHIKTHVHENSQLSKHVLKGVAK